MTQRQSLLRYTKSVHKLCMEHGKESDDSDGEGQAPGNQDVKILYPLFISHIQRILHLISLHTQPLNIFNFH